MPRFFRPFLIALTVAVTFLAGIYVGGHYYRISPLISALPADVRSALFPGDDLLQLQREIEGILRENYYQPVDRVVLQNGALNGMIGSLGDPYSVYYSPDDYRTVQLRQHGEFVGIGVLLEMKDGQLTVVSTLEDTPASEAGISAGDMVIAVDGESLAGKDEAEGAALMRGELGTQVVVTIRRDGEEIDFELTRRRIEMPIIYNEMIEEGGMKIAYVNLQQFPEDSGAKLRGAIEMMIAEGAEGLILDLRYNGGGILNESIEAASLFIQNGAIVSVVGRDSKSQVYEARGDANESIPMVVLINEFTASAAEIVAGALKDSGRATLIGETTFGKGVVQMILPLSNGGAVKFTSGVYHTPGGIAIDEIGVQPDIPVTDNPETPEVDEVLERGLLELTS
ncbi:MAG: S41 family peptidase [Thermoleophilia bacterium]|nr:S41 family peptidase [Thermoleophilia bacterium]